MWCALSLERRFVVFGLLRKSRTLGPAFLFVRKAGLEPARPRAGDFKSPTSTCSVTRASACVLFFFALLLCLFCPFVRLEFLWLRL